MDIHSTAKVLLALRDFGKFLLDPTSLLWAVSFVVLVIL